MNFFEVTGVRHFALLSLSTSIGFFFGGIP
jgi:hypothetical protein